MKLSKFFTSCLGSLTASVLFIAVVAHAQEITTNVADNQVQIKTTQTTPQTENIPAPPAFNNPEATPPSLSSEGMNAPSVAGSPGRLWNLQDADIISVINEVSQETGKNFVIDPRVNGKISLISSKPLRQKEVYQVFLTILGMLGYSAVPSGNVVKILPNMESAEQATRVANRGNPGKGDELVVRVIPLDNVSSTQLIPILRPLLPQWSNISAYTPGNVLILVGRAANLQRIVNIIQDVDKASTNGIQIIQLHHASAVQMSAVLNNLQNAARAAGEMPSVSIAVDERSNSILLSGPKAMRLRIRVLIAQLDAVTNTPEGNTEVIYLRYLQAKPFALILGKIAQNMAGKDSSLGNSRYDMGGGSTMNVMVSGPGGVAANKEFNQSSIQAEPNTNAIIITAPPALMQALRSVIARLDIRPAQVQVEAVIAEVEESNLRSLGIQWGGISDGKVVIGGQGSLPTDFPPLGAGVVGLIPRTDLRAVLSALENLSGVDILSTPTIMVLDNQKAFIEIGQEVPYQTGSYTTPTGTDNARTVQPFTTTQPKPVTLRLDVTPQINLGCSVRLKLKLKNDTLANPVNPGTNPIINTSSIANSVLVQDGDILVLGGLLKNSNNENINKVPILGDIPIVGILFQQKARTVSKKNLMIFIKPIIVQTPDDANAISFVKYTNIRRTQANFRDDLKDIGKERAPTLLPPWKNRVDLPTPFDVGKTCPPGQVC